jgi:hypothetical protein
LPFPRCLICLPGFIFARGICKSLLGALGTFKQVIGYIRVCPFYLPFPRRLIGLLDQFFALGPLGTLSTFKQVIGYIRLCPFYLPFPRRLIDLPGRLSAQGVAYGNHCWAHWAHLGRSTGTSLLLAFSETCDQSPWSHIRKEHVGISAGALSTFRQVVRYFRVCPFNLPFPRRLISLPGRLSAQLAAYRQQCWAL